MSTIRGKKTVFQGTTRYRKIHLAAAIKQANGAPLLSQNIALSDIPLPIIPRSVARMCCYKKKIGRCENFTPRHSTDVTKKKKN